MGVLGGLTWNMRLALSLSVDSSGESIGVCSVNRVSNWETSSSPVWKKYKIKVLQIYIIFLTGTDKE